MNEDIKVTFIIPNECSSENDCSEEMQLAYIACEQHSGGGLQAMWVKETQWTQFEGLSKRDVFVLTDFEGQLYEKLKVTKCLLVGPRCLSCCLTEGTPIPSGPEPVFTIAMRGLVVTASGLTKQEKENIKKKVHWMGGIYNTVLTDDTTHLVSDTVISDKYIKSVEKGIPVMCKSWVEAVWEASLQMNINGSSSQFEVHKLPPFHNLQVTTSGISKKDKQMIMKLVNENGGVFSGAFQSETTDVVVLNKEGVGSDKYKAALEYGKACVLPAWVRASAAARAALPLARYRVAGALTSSPLTARVPDISLNFSHIRNVKPPNNFVDETRSADITTMSDKMKMSQEAKRTSDTSIDKEIEEAFENFDMSLLKKVGPIFDGFCIWTVNVSGAVRERCAAMVSRCGGVRAEAWHARVTHVVCARAPAPPAAPPAAPHAAPLLSPLWLLRSVQAGAPLPDTEFLIERKPSTPVKSKTPGIEPASPMSKRNLQLLRRPPLDLPPPTAQTNEPNDELVNHYLSQHIPEEPPKEKTPEPAPRVSDVTMRQEPDITDDMDDPTEEIEQIFRGIKLEVVGLDEEAVCEIGAEVAAAGGALCAGGGAGGGAGGAGGGAGGTHLLLPLDAGGDDLAAARGAAETVTVFWLKDCLSQQELLPIQYYHRPVKLPPLDPEDLPLKGVVASLSTYSGVERAFLDELAKLLGATTQLRFCRRTTASALASTHLICPAPAGDKYSGAVKWGLPAVSARWLTDCARAGTRLPEGPYLVGETIAPPIQKSPPPCEPPSPPTEPPTEPTSKDKENAMLPPPAGEVPRRASLPTREHTPKAQHNNAPPVEEMSPASRYIALARQGLLGDSQETPKRNNDRQNQLQKEEGSVRTPTLDDALSSPNLATLSPTTRRRLQAVKRGEMPSDPIRTPTDPFEKNVSTPDSGFGAPLRPGSGRLSPENRKRLWKLVHDLPGKLTLNTRESHTPLSEIRNRFLAQFSGAAPTPPTPPSDHHLLPRKLQMQDQADTPPPAKIARTCADQSPGSASKSQRECEADGCGVGVGVERAAGVERAVEAQLQRLSAALADRSQRARRNTLHAAPPATLHGPESEPTPASQPNTVGWDDSSPTTVAAQNEEPPPVRRFMLSSNVDNREEITEMIVMLGGEVCEGGELDPLASHLLCAAPGRSEKMLGCVAAGRWVLHPAYVARSKAAGRFLEEEQFEWGNPLATCLPALGGAELELARAASRWRRARAAGLPPPYRGLVALLHVPAPRRALLARLVRAGGGEAPDIEPPYSDPRVTVCFADVKRCPLSARDAAWLRARRVPVCAPVLLTAYLTDPHPPDPARHCLPQFSLSPH